MNKACLCIFIFLLSLVLPSCSQQHKPEAHFIDYQQRLARVLDVDLATLPRPEGVSVDTLGVVLPRKRDRRIVTPENKLKFLDFLRLDNCQVKQLVAERNNQLGKHMQAASGIAYELAVRAALTDCIPKETSQQLRAQLSSAQKAKQQSVAADFWQYSFGSEWYGRFASTSVQPLDWEDASTLVASRQAFEEINTWLLPVLQQPPQLFEPSSDKATLNQSIQVLESGQGLGRVVVSITLAINELERANQVLAQASQQQLCSQRQDGSLQPNKKMTYLQNVVSTYFGNGIQVYLAGINKQGGVLLSKQQMLYDAFQNMSQHELTRLTLSDKRNLKAVERYILHTSQLPELLKVKVREHVQAVQQTMQICVN